MARAVGAPDGAGTSEAWRAAHRRLYEHLCASTQEGDQPTLEALQPLYQAVAHGCQAGLQQEACEKVYYARILQKNENYTAHKLGAFGSDLGAIACFFDTPWSHVSPSLNKIWNSWVLSESASRLRAVGRLIEALHPTRAAFVMFARLGDIKNAPVSVNNMSELELTLGELAESMENAERSVAYADGIGDEFMRCYTRTTHADTLHQADRRAEAEARFREAEQMQAERQPAYPLLYSVQGFRYCDLLLAEAERAAWQRHLECGGKRQRDAALGRARSAAVGESATDGEASSSASGNPPRASGASQSGVVAAALQSCRAVSKRAAQTLKWAERNNVPLLDIALDHLTLGRAALYAAILDSPDSALRIAHSELASAVSGLRRAGQQNYLPLGLLTRAWQRSLTGALTSAQAGPDSAQSDLGEAWEIAERGPMPLFLADIHLYQARLFGRSKDEGRGSKETPPPKYPWQSPQHDLAEARRLIFKHGYLRRKEELEDAERAIG